MQHSCSITHKETGVFLVNEQKTKWVAIISLLTMVLEIVFGYWTGSMALLADGWHMASHSLALGLSVLVYYLYRHPRFRSAFTFGGGKILSLGGYTSAIFLVLIAITMIVESISRFYERPTIQYEEALIVAIIGLVVNLVCAWILHNGDTSHEHQHHHHGEKCDHKASRLGPVHNHHHHHHHGTDHNHQSAYVHILTDALTSVFAIVALLMGMWQGWSWFDPLVGVIGGLVVMKWSLGLIKQSGMDLLDAHDPSIDRQSLITALERDGSKVIDLHLWKLAPDQIGCEIIIKNNQQQRSGDYRDVIQRNFNIHHLIIEVV
jgi:cation diffusion facilitator family transporter